MIMTKINRIVEKSDLIPTDIYTKDRKQIRKKLVEYKKNRRVSIGPYATFYFENFDTMLAQIQEMLHIEKGGEDQLKDELNADNPIVRADFLGKVGRIEEKVYINVGEEKIKAIPEIDVDRTSAEGKASSVQFLHFNFSKDQIKKFKDINTKVIIGIEHKLYNHTSQISQDQKVSLSEDFN